MSSTRLKQARQGRGWSQEELAERASLPQPTISRAERNGTATVSVALKIANALEQRVEDLFDIDPKAARAEAAEASPVCDLVPDTTPATEVA